MSIIGVSVVKYVSVCVRKLRDGMPTDALIATEATYIAADLLDAIVSASEDHVFVLDAESRFLYVCAGGAAVLGMARPACLNKTSAEIGLPAYFQEMLEAGMQRVRSGEQQVRGQIQMPAQAGGAEREFDYALLRLPSGPMVCTARDVTDRNQARRDAAAHLAALTEANARLAALANTDGLTGLLNHRSLHERLAEEFLRASRHAQPLSVLMVDLDRFKTINDTRGHLAGDDALRALAGVLHQAARETDILGRCGGDEFIVILPQTDELGALPLAERMRAAVETADGPLNGVTVSVGACSLHNSHADFAALVACVDAALYRSKASGRNQVAA